MSLLNEMIYDLTTIKQTFYVPQERKELFGEVTTDFKLIEEMFSQFPESIFSNPNLSWLDVGAGKGYFSLVLYNKLYEGLKHIFPDSLERKKHIITNMITLIELNEHHDYQLKLFFSKEANIIIEDFLSYEPSKKYDIVYGNPPYTCLGSIKTPTNTKINKKQDGKCIWGDFVKHSLFLLKPGGYLSFIIPSLWMRPDKAKLHSFMLQYKIHKCKCLNNTQTNKWFKGNAQTPTCFFLLEKTKTNHMISLYDPCYETYKNYNFTIEKPLPLFGCSIIQKLNKFVEKYGCIQVEKTNMPPISAKLNNTCLKEFPFSNIHTCKLDGLKPKLKIQYSNKELKYSNVPKLVLAHKMYGFPFYDITGKYGISNRDNYVIINKTQEEFFMLQDFLSTKLALYVFESTRYRMKYLEKEAFLFLPNICAIPNFSTLQTKESIYLYFDINETERNHIESFSKNYENIN